MPVPFRRACEADGCGEVVLAPKRFCVSHWQRIPEEMQSKICWASEGADRDSLVIDAVAILRANDKRRRDRGT
jgi:hypothetical protein